MGTLGAAVIALAGSGLRIGELLRLDVSDIDFLRRTIRVAVGQTVIDALAAFLKAGLFVNAMGLPLTYRQWKPLWQTAAKTAKVEATAHARGHPADLCPPVAWDDDRTRAIIDAVLSPPKDSVRTETAP